MILVGTVGLTLITMAYLENQGKISINKNILFVLSVGFSGWAGWWGIKEIVETFL